MAAAVIICAVAAFFGFKKAAHEKAAPDEQWYHITITGSPATDPANQLIGSTRGTPPGGVDEEECTLDNNGDPCSVLMEFDDLSTDPEDLQGLTVEQAGIQEDATALDYAKQPPLP